MWYDVYGCVLLAEAGWHVHEEHDFEFELPSLHGYLKLSVYAYALQCCAIHGHFVA